MTRREEIEKARPKLNGNMDALVWAEEFMFIIKNTPNIILDEGLMIGWFANAIMTGFDTGINRERARTQKLVEAMGEITMDQTHASICSGNCGYCGPFKRIASEALRDYRGEK